jgi:hypothetical protein
VWEHGTGRGHGRREGKQRASCSQNGTRSRAAIAKERLFAEAQVRENVAKGVAGGLEVVEREAEYDCRKAGRGKMWICHGPRVGVPDGRGRNREGQGEGVGARSKKREGRESDTKRHQSQRQRVRRPLAHPKFNRRATVAVGMTSP